MHPILFNAGPITIYSYGVLLAAAYLTGLWLAVRRARAAGIDGNRIMDLLIWVIIAALVGAKALLFIVDFEHFTSSWEEFTTLLRSGGVFYGGLIAAILVCIYQLRKHRLAAVALGRSVRPRHCPGLHGRPPRLPDGRLLLRQADRRGVGHHLHRPGRQLQRRHAAQRGAAPDPAVRGGRRPGDPRRAAAARKAPGVLPRPHVLELRVPVFRAPLLHRVLSRRRSRPRARHAVDIAVHLGGARPAQPPHAVVPEPRQPAGRAEVPSTAHGPRKPRFT